MERRVVNQLAAAHEKGHIGKGSTVQVTAHWPEHAESPDIKLRVWKKGFKDFVDIENVKESVKNIHLLFGFK